MIFHQATYHAVFGHQQGRSYIACKFASRPRDDFALASLWHTSDYTFRPHHHYEHPDADPALQRMVAELRALGARAQSLAETGGAFSLSKNGGERRIGGRDSDAQRGDGSSESESESIGGEGEGEAGLHPERIRSSRL